MNKLFKIMIYIIILLLILILLKSNNNYKKKFYDLIYKENISFAKINKWYSNKFGLILPQIKVNPVFIENFNLSKKLQYKDGVLITVEGQLIPALSNGVVIFKGYKKEYGNTIIIQQDNGIDLWYCNLLKSDLNMFEYIEKGKIIGSVSKELYLVFTKNGEIIDYKKYI